MPPHAVTRRKFVESSTLCLAGAAVLPGRWNFSTSGSPFPAPLEEFGYDQVSLNSEIHETQFQHSISVLMGLNEDSLLKPMRQMGGQSATGEDLGGWYNYDPNYDWHTFDAGFAPGATYGQWVSALARAYAIRWL